MKIAVLGATGRAGRLVVAEALERGWEVRALVRDPAKMATKHARLDLVPGQATSAGDVNGLVRGCDAVVSTLGIVKGGRDDVCSEGTKHALAAMREHGVRRLVVLGGAGACAPGENKPLSGKLINIAMKAFLGPLVRDKERELAMLVQSDVDWTVVRPPMLREGPKGAVRVDERSPPSTKLSYPSLAAFMVDEVFSKRFIRRAPYVSA